MSDNSVDPSGNTEAFRAFSQQPAPEPATAAKTPMIAGGIVLAVVVIAALVWLIA